MQSLAASSLLTFLLQVRGRHSVGAEGAGGGLVIDAEGRVQPFALHSLFDPPHPSDRNVLRLTHDMLELLGAGRAAGGGGFLSSEPFKYLCSLMVRGYLAVRLQHELLLSLVSLMLQSGVAGVKKDALEQLRVRLQLDMNEREASQFLMERIRESAIEASSSYL